MRKEQKHTTDRILNLTLEIIYLLTGEIMSKNEDHITLTVPPTEFLVPKRKYKEKVLEVTQKIIELLTGEVPIRCQDVTVYFSMEEWEYLEGHKDLYKDVTMEDELPPPSPDVNFRDSEVLMFSNLESLGEDPVINVNHSAAKASTPELTKPCALENVPETSASCQEEEEEDLPHSDDSTLHAQYTTTQIKEESLSAEEEFAGTGHSYIYDDFDHELASDTLHSFERVEPQYEFFPYSELEEHFTAQKPLSRTGYSRPPVGGHQKTTLRKKTYTYLQRGKCFRNNSDLTAHRGAHAVEKSYPCPHCGKAFNRKSNLAIHVRIHTGEKPYSCTMCGKRFSNKSDCIIHQRIHTGEKPYPCYECGRSFVSNSHRISHQRSHTGEKPFLCSRCGKCFRNRSDLQIHERTHTGEKPFACTKCGKNFASKSSLVRHQNRKLHQGEFDDINGT